MSKWVHYIQEQIFLFPSIIHLVTRLCIRQRILAYPNHICWTQYFKQPLCPQGYLLNNNKEYSRRESRGILEDFWKKKKGVAETELGSSLIRMQYCTSFSRTHLWKTDMDRSKCGIYRSASPLPTTPPCPLAHYLSPMSAPHSQPSPCDPIKATPPRKPF